LNLGDDEAEDLVMKLFSNTLYDDSRIWYDGLPNGSIKNIEQLEEIFMNKWSLHKMFPSLDVEDISGIQIIFLLDW
jgi:hypothetical protein